MKKNHFPASRFFMVHALKVMIWVSITLLYVFSGPKAFSQQPPSDNLKFSNGYQVRFKINTSLETRNSVTKEIEKVLLEGNDNNKVMIVTSTGIENSLVYQFYIICPRIPGEICYPCTCKNQCRICIELQKDFVQDGPVEEIIDINEETFSMASLGIVQVSKLLMFAH